jgi:uncharacterized protein
MAYVIGRKVVKDTESDFDSFAYGISSPTKRGAVMFEQTFTSYDAAKSNLRNLMLTARGERVMQPEFGTGLHELLFEPFDDTYESRLQDMITQSVNFWLPYITVESIEVDMSDEMKDRHIANVNIQFTVGNEIDTQEITFTVQG